MFEEARLAPRLRSLKHDLVGDVGTVLWVLMGTIGMVLLIACANVANLLLVRAEGRQQELAIRAALGAGRGHIARELLVESMALGVLGGLPGLASPTARCGCSIALAPGNLPRLDQIAIDGRCCCSRWPSRSSPACCSAPSRSFKYAGRTWPRPSAAADGP